MILDEIIGYKKIEIETRKKENPRDILERKISQLSKPKEFLKKSEKIQLVAELKKASPLKGIIREDFSAVSLAKICAEAGASALSVLTEEKFFNGSIEYLSSVRDAVTVPVLRKDFIIDEYQIIESRAYGADAILLLASILNLRIIQRFLDLSNGLGMDCLVEAHTLDELKMILDTNARIVGINNRDLKTFEVDIKNTERLLNRIPKDKIVVSESGISNRKDVEYLEGLGVSAALVGTAIMASPSVGDKVKELLGYGKG